MWQPTFNFIASGCFGLLFSSLVLFAVIWTKTEHSLNSKWSMSYSLHSFKNNERGWPVKHSLPWTGKSDMKLAVESWRRKWAREYIEKELHCKRRTVSYSQRGKRDIFLVLGLQYKTKVRLAFGCIILAFHLQWGGSELIAYAPYYT